MKTITTKESEAILKIFRDFNIDYNANSLSKKLGITSRGALKILNRLFSEKILVRKQLGGAVFYKFNFMDDYAKKLIETLLIKETREKAPRWLSEFEALPEKARIAVVFGSAIRDYDKAKDVDLIIGIDKNRYNEVSKFIDEKNSILIKPIHPVIMTVSDLERNLKNKNPATETAIKEGHILCGYEKIIEVMKNVTSF